MILTRQRIPLSPICIFHVSRLMPHVVLKLERAVGVEPTTASLEGWDSTAELRPPSSSHVGLSASQDDVATGHSRLLYDRQSFVHRVWWAGKDSNLGSRWQQIYSLPPLATWVPAQIPIMEKGELAASDNPPLCRDLGAETKVNRPFHSPPAFGDMQPDDCLRDDLVLLQKRLIL